MQAVPNRPQKANGWSAASSSGSTHLCRRPTASGYCALEFGEYTCIRHRERYGNFNFNMHTLPPSRIHSSTQLANCGCQRPPHPGQMLLTHAGVEKFTPIVQINSVRATTVHTSFPWVKWCSSFSSLAYARLPFTRDFQSRSTLHCPQSPAQMRIGRNLALPLVDNWCWGRLSRIFRTGPFA